MFHNAGFVARHKKLLGLIGIALFIAAVLLYQLWSVAEKTISSVNMVPSKVQILNAFTWLMNFGMHMMPSMYPQIVAVSVYDGKTFASSKLMFIELA